MFMEDNSQNVERNLNKLFEKMYVDKYPDLIDYAVFTVTYTPLYEGSEPYYDIHLDIILNPNNGGYHGFAKKLNLKSADLHGFFKNFVKYIQPFNMSFDFTTHQDED